MHKITFKDKSYKDFSVIQFCQMQDKIYKRLHIETSFFPHNSLSNTLLVEKKVSRDGMSVCREVSYGLIHCIPPMELVHNSLVTFPYGFMEGFLNQLVFPVAGVL